MTQAIQYFKALADETRLRLLHILYHHELNVNELVGLMKMGQSRISRHLKILSSAGLLVARREGLWVFYAVPSEGGAREFIDSIVAFLGNTEAFKADMSVAKGMIEERIHRAKRFFNSIAADWDKLSREILGDFDLSREVLAVMPSCGVAADLGCGTGNVLRAMRDKADVVIGVDGSLRMLEIAKSRFAPNEPCVSLRIGDLSHLPLRDEEADFICLNLVLHHVPTPREVLVEIRRVIRPGGYLLVTDFNSHNIDSMREEYGDHWLGFNAATLCTHLTKAGFSIKSMKTAPVERQLSLHIILAEKTA